MTTNDQGSPAGEPLPKYVPKPPPTLAELVPWVMPAVLLGLFMLWFFLGRR